MLRRCEAGSLIGGGVNATFGCALSNLFLAFGGTEAGETGNQGVSGCRQNLLAEGKTER